MSKNHSNLWAIVPAAGSGQRMRSELPKQYLKVHDRYVLEYSLEVLLAHSEIRQIVLCVAESDIIWPTLALSQDPRVISTLGGETRAQSVLNGLRCLSSIAGEDDWVLVHDAARPCLQATQLDHLIEQLREHKVGGILAVPANDTLKLSAQGGATVEQTLDRSRIWHAQTPQMFRYGILNKALESALDNDLAVTDECSAIELAGYAAKLVEGDWSNIKLTTPADMIAAAAILAP